MYFDDSYFVVKQGGGSRALKMRDSSPKNNEKWAGWAKKGGSIDPLDPPILTGVD